MSRIDKKELREYDEWNKDRYDNRLDKDNICPIGITDREFVCIMKNLFLGGKWYTSLSLGHDQINEEILEEIICRITGKEAKQRLK